MTRPDAHYAICVSSLGEYRLAAMQILQKEFGEQLIVYTAGSAIDPTVRVLQPHDHGFCNAPTKTLLGFTFQAIPLAVRLGSKVLLMDLNPRMPQIWATVLARKILRRRTLLWGHAWPRKGRTSATARLRLLLANLADGVVTYTHTQATELATALRNRPTYAAPNAIDRASDFQHSTEHDRTSFIYVGRLVRAKKVNLLLEAFAASTAPLLGNLIVVGAGPERANLEFLAHDLGIADKVVFVGHVSKRAELEQLYSMCIASVSPGYVGLALIQSLSFGVPMIYPNGENHSPEIEAATQENSITFRANDKDGLAASIDFLVEDRHQWSARGTEIMRVARSTYSAERMASGLASALRGVRP